jgi:heavy metal efflux system protein
MVRKLIDWSLANPFIVILLTLALTVVGGVSFWRVNVEAYPDPAPAIIEVVAQFPGASAEEVERQVTIPLEIALAGMPGLESTRSKSLFGLAHLRNQFDYSRDYDQAKQDVINRISQVTLPAGVTPQISPASPIGEILRYTLINPRDRTGRPVYTLADLKSVQDSIIQRALLRVPRIGGVTAFGGEIKRYEIQPDPGRLQRFGVPLSQLQSAVNASNSNGSGDAIALGANNLVVRSIGLYGNGQDPVIGVLGMTDPVAAAAFFRSEEARRIREIRQTVVASVNNVPVRIDQLVDGGPQLEPDGSQRSDDIEMVSQGVVVSHQTRQGHASISRRIGDATGDFHWEDDNDAVSAIVLLRKGQDSLPALRDVALKIEELNKPGHLPPGMRIEPFHNRTELIDLTTETVRENLLLGMGLVSAILLMFLGNIRVALIVAINIPLALLFAFSVLFLRGRSANLLSIGAVDFGIIVDSTVILVESIYRHLSTGQNANEKLELRVAMAAREVERSLLFSTIIMVCALLPLFTMKGPEGQIFGPMADTYAFAIGGALLLAVTLSPVLCMLLLRHLKSRRDNILVRTIQWLYVLQLKIMLFLRWGVLAAFIALVGWTGYTAATMGREFMPELEEGNLYIRGTFPINISLPEVMARGNAVRRLLRDYGEIESIVPAIGRPDDGTDPTGFYNMEIFVPLKPVKRWPIDPSLGRPRNKDELVKLMNDDLDLHFPGVDWDFSQAIRDNVMEALSGVKGENSIKVFGPDLDRLEALASKIKDELGRVPGVENAGVFRIQGQSNLEFPIDRRKCARWNASIADVEDTIQAAVGGKPLSQMIEGGKSFDITVRFPEKLRRDEASILELPVEITGHQVAAGALVMAPTPTSGGSSGLSPTGTSLSPPALTGSADAAPTLPGSNLPRRRLADLVTPLNAKGQPDETGSFVRPGASTIYREQGERLIAIKFAVRGRDLAGAVAEAKTKVEPLLSVPYRAEWSGEFQEMQDAEERLVKVFGVSLVLIMILLYMAFRSWLDASVVLANVIAMGVGGVWSLKLADLNLNISAAVGFISILGVAVMNGLLFVAAFNRARSHGADLRETLLEGTAQLVRPVTMTALAAILGLLPAAYSTRIGAQSQRPLAIVVVGGMAATLVLMNIVPVLYSFYGRRQPKAASDFGH